MLRSTRLLLSVILPLLTQSNLLGQLVDSFKDREQTSFIKTFSVNEVKIFYGPARRKVDIEDIGSTARIYFDNKRKGNELTIEVSTSIDKNISFSFLHSSFKSQISSTGVRLGVPGGYFILTDEQFTFSRTGLSINLSKFITRKSYSKFHASFGGTICHVTDEMTLQGSGRPFDVRLRDQSDFLPFVSLGISTAFLSPNLNIHLRFTKYTGTYRTLKSDDASLTRDNSKYDLNTLKQHSFQVGLSWILRSTII